MQLTSQLDFAADPATVAAMLTERSFLERVCAQSDAIDYSVEVVGNRSKVSRTLNAPSSAAKFTGERVTIVEAVDWSGTAADGVRRGTLALTIPGLPVTMDGSAVIAEGGRGTTVAYDADLKVNLPFVGRKLEASAAPAILAGIELQQRVGDQWLAEHTDAARDA